MKNLILMGCLLMSFSLSAKSNLTANFVMGDPGIASINALAFGPEGILFIGDSKNATVYAIDTEDTEAHKSADAISIKQVDKLVAEQLGTTPDQIHIQDMAVNPVSKVLYLAVHHQDGKPVLLKLAGETFEWVALDKVSYSQKAISGVYDEEAKDRRGRPLRVWTVSDLSYYDGQVLVTGLSNQEFSSTFRSLGFPFSDEGSQDASLELYHAAHGQYETYAPIKAFTVGEVNGAPHLIAGYTCTPLVVFPMDELAKGTHTKGRTVAELGNWNTPLDMITMTKGGETYLLMANSNRSFMKIKFSDIEQFEGSLTERIKERSGTAGIPFIALPWVNVLQLDKLDDTQFVMLKRESTGELNLVTQSDRWL
ncbi:MAG: hypothetical protein AAFV07_10995 [Bacteroidota bacterium]